MKENKVPGRKAGEILAGRGDLNNKLVEQKHGQMHPEG